MWPKIELRCLTMWSMTAVRPVRFATSTLWTWSYNLMPSIWCWHLRCEIHVKLGEGTKANTITVYLDWMCSPWQSRLWSRVEECWPGKLGCSLHYCQSDLADSGLLWIEVLPENTKKTNTVLWRQHKPKLHCVKYIYIYKSLYLLNTLFYWQCIGRLESLWLNDWLNANQMQNSSKSCVTRTVSLQLSEFAIKYLYNNLHQSQTRQFYLRHLCLYQRASSEEACSVLLPVLAKVVMRCGKKLVMCGSVCSCLVK